MLSITPRAQVEGLTGLEPATFCMASRHSSPIELQPHMVGVRNYDIPTYCLKGNCSSPELHTHVVGLVGHDPTASDLRDQYSAN